MIDTTNQLREVEIDLAHEIEHLEQLIGGQHIDLADQYLTKLSPANRLIVLSRLPRDERRALFLGLAAEKAADYLHDIPEVQALGLLEKLDPERAADILEILPKDEQADLVGELSDQLQESILAEMDAQDAADVRDLIEYEDEEAGGMMVVEFVSVPQESRVRDVTAHLQLNAEEYSDYDVQYIYVVEQSTRRSPGRLVGVMPLRNLLLSPPDTPIAQIMIANPISVDVHTGLGELHQFFVDHNFVGVPVVDAEGALLGVLRRSDVEETMAEQYADDYLKTQGIVDEELRSMPLLLRSRRRLAWLSVNILLNVLAASVIAFYQETLAQVIALAVFLPIISDMSGCSGNQAVAVSMRELALGVVRPGEVVHVWLKEVGVGMINGLCLGILIAIVAAFWQGSPWLGAVVGVAMMVNTIIAVSLGGTLPLVMRLFKLDPALASGPILTTVTDMCGFFLVLSFASIALDKLVSI